MLLRDPVLRIESRAGLKDQTFRRCRRSLAYFQLVIEERLEHPVPDNYVEYLRLNVRRIAGDKPIRRMSRNIRFQMITNTPPVNASSISKWLCDEQPRHGLAHRLHFSGRFSRR